jgi:hypothetical protein
MAQPNPASVRHAATPSAAGNGSAPDVASVSDLKRVAIIIASIFLGMAVIGMIVEGTGGDGEWFFIPLGLVLNPVTLLIVLVVFLVRRKGGQQQQQQVVVVGGGQPQATGGPQLRCGKCQGLSKAEAKFCGQCGTPF